MGACQSTNKNPTKINRIVKDPSDDTDSKHESKITKLENNYETGEDKNKNQTPDPLKKLPNVKKDVPKVEKDLNLPDAKNKEVVAKKELMEPIGVLNGKSEIATQNKISMNNTENKLPDGTKADENSNEQEIESVQPTKTQGKNLRESTTGKEDINGYNQNKESSKKASSDKNQEQPQKNQQIIDIDQIRANDVPSRTDKENTLQTDIVNTSSPANINGKTEKITYSQYRPASSLQGSLLNLENQFDSLERENGVTIPSNNNPSANTPITLVGNEINIQEDNKEEKDAKDPQIDMKELRMSDVKDDETTKYETSNIKGVDTLRMNIREKSRGLSVKPNIPDIKRSETMKNKNIENKQSQFSLTEADLAIYELMLNTSNKTPFDPNFEMKKLIISELSLEQFNSMIKANNNSLIFHLIPFIVDFFRRRLDLKGIKEIFSKYNKLNKASIKVTNLSQRNIIELLLHVINTDSKITIGHMLQSFNYYLPLTFWKYNFEKKLCEYHTEFPLIYTMINQDKPIFFNFGLTNSIGKTELLSDLFSIEKNNLNISNMSGVLREGTIDLYTRSDVTIFDLNQFSLKEPVLRIFKEILKISTALFIHFDYLTLKREVKSDKFKAMEPLIDPKKRLVIFIRNYDEEENDVIDKSYIQKFFKNKIEIFDIFLIKNLAKINSEEKEQETSDMREKFKKSYTKLREDKRNFNAFYLEDSLTDSVNNRYKDYEYVENKLAILNKNEESQTSPFAKLLKFSFEKYKIEKLEKEKLPTSHSALKKIDITQTFLQVFNELLIQNEKNKLIALDSHLEKISEDYLRPLIQQRNKILESLIGMKIHNTKSSNEESKTMSPDGKDLINSSNNIAQYRTTSLQKELSNLNEEIENNNITFDHFYSDLFYFYDFYNSMEYEKGNLNDLFDNLKKAYIREVVDGYPIHIIKSNLVSIHHQFLEEIFQDDYFREKKYFVISILGMQSSAKSTLLNYLFGTNFKVSSGRCTRGIYASLIQTENPNENIILLDTEGLSSIEGHDKLFDHQMALMCFGLSHLVLINHKGELSKNLQELLEISLYAMNYMSILNKSNPKIFFVLRDQIEREGDKHNAALAKAKLQLQEIANKQNINLEDVMKIDLENLILLPSAFKENTENGINIISPSNTFSKEVLKLRKKIFGEFDVIKNAKKLSNLRNFYNHACNLWTSFNKYGIDLLSCDSLREYEQKLEITDEIKKLVEAENKKLTKDINMYLETSYDSIKTLSKLVDDQYEIYITNVYNESIKWILFEIEENFKNKRQFPQKIIEEGFETIKDNMNLLKKHMLYFWKTKFVYLNRDIQTKQLQNEIKTRIEKEIEKIVEYSEEEKEVLDNLNNVTSEYKKKLIENIPLPALEEIRKSCFQTFNYSAKFPFPKIKFSELDEVEKINKKNWLHFSFVDNFTNVLNKSINPREVKDMEVEKLNVLIEFEEFMKNVFLNFEKTEVVSDDKVMWYTTQIENFLKTDNTKHGFDRFNKDILYKDLSLIFISKLSEIIYENQNKKYIKEINFITENISNIYKDSIDLFNTRKDNLKFTEKLAQSYLTDLFNNIRLIHSAQIISIVEKEFEDLPKDPEEFIRYAYEISFNRKNGQNVFKFVMDINKFLLEIFYDLVKNKKEHIVNIFKDKFETDIINKRKKFESLVNTFQIDNKKKGIDKFFLKEFNLAISKSLELSDFISVKNIYDKIENNLSDFCQIFLSSVRNFYSDKSSSNSMLQNTFIEIESRMNKFLEDKRNLIIGCQHVCPFCNSKCIKPAGEHSNHQAIHVINGFGGCKCVDNNEAILEYCLSKANMERKWRNPRDPSQFHKGIVEVCEFHFPDWVEDFQTNSKILSKDEEEKQMHCWYYVRKPICHYYGMKDHTNPNYLLDPNNILPEEFSQNY